MISTVADRVEVVSEGDGCELHIAFRRPRLARAQAGPATASIASAAVTVPGSARSRAEIAASRRAQRRRRRAARSIAPVSSSGAWA